MKKFLSLVLALVMTMSLVTISAGATEYKDLTDKDEIQYEEAVAVLNRIGIITGYDDGTFRPETELTRGAAAKIIVSLMIGPEAASALPNTYSPYPDVPAGHTFAGVISYCKTAGYISGYGDGTFKPANSLTGFAFAKMLLGALGYKSDLEGFTGTGWTMNVAKLGNAAGLFNRLDFQGAEAVNREEACQLALNTLNGTMVEYTGGFNIVSGDATIVGNQTRTYVTSNQAYAQNIDNRKIDVPSSAVDNHYTVEFGEEHFKDLRLNDEHENRLDDFGRPSNHWSYKKVTIGVFPIEADFVYTTQVACKDDVKVTDASKIRALGLSDYYVDNDTEMRVNGKQTNIFTDAKNDIAKIADYTDNGTVVEVYVDEDEADWVRNVVVVQTQLMQVKKLNSESVTMKLYDDDGADDKLAGFNQEPIDVKVSDVEVDDDYYEFLKGLKVDDIVAVIPLTTDDVTYTVSKAYTPETVSGALTGSKTFANDSVEDAKRSVIEVTVGGTTYKVADWNVDLNDINRDILKVTKKDVTLYLDEFGNAMLAKNVGSTNEYMILGSWKNAVVNNTIVRIAEGWDIKGNAVSLNVGSEQSAAVRGYDGWTKDGRPGVGFEPGDVLRYSNEGVTGVAEWTLSKAGVFEVPGNRPVTNAEAYSIKSSNSTVTLKDYDIADDKPLVAGGIKTIYVTFDESGDVDFIEVKSGLENISFRELQTDKDHHKDRAEATVSSLDSALKAQAKSDVTAIVIKRDSNDASLKNLGYVYDYNTTNNKDENGDIITDYKTFTRDDETVQKLSGNNIANRRFVRYSELENDLWRLRVYDRVQAGTSTVTATIVGTATPSQKNDNMYRLGADSYKHVSSGAPRDGSVDDEYPNIRQQGADGVIDGVDLTVGDTYANLISVKGAKFLDLRNKPALEVTTAKDLHELVKDGYSVTVDIAFNDNPDADEFRLAYIVVITGATKDGTGTISPTGGTVTFADTGKATDKLGAEISNAKIKRSPDGRQAVASFTFTTPDWVDNQAAAGQVQIFYDVYADGKKAGEGSSIIHNADSAAYNLVQDADDPSMYTVQEVWLTTGDFLKDYGIQESVAPSVKDISMVITSVQYGWVRVNYKLEDGTVLSRQNTDGAYLSSRASIALKPLFRETLSATGTFSSDGLTTEKTDEGYTTASPGGQKEFGTLKALGTRPVTITISSSDPVTKKHILQAKWGTETAASSMDGGLNTLSSGLPTSYTSGDKLTVSFAPSAGTVSDGGVASVKFALSNFLGGADGLTWAYDVTYKVNDGTEETVRLDPKGGGGVDESVSLGKVMEDVLVTVTKVEPVKADNYAVSAAGSAAELKVKYTGTITNVRREKITTLNDGDTVKYEGDTLIITFATAVSNNTTIDIDAAVEIGGKWAKQCKVTFSGNAWGTPNSRV